MFPRTVVCPSTAATSRMARMSFAAALNTMESPAHRWCDPVQWALRAHCSGHEVVRCRLLEWPRAVSGCLPPAATFFHRPGDWVLHARALRRRTRSSLHADLRSYVECGDQSPLTNGLTLRPSSMRVKSTGNVCQQGTSSAHVDAWRFLATTFPRLRLVAVQGGTVQKSLRVSDLFLARLLCYDAFVAR